VSAVAPPLVHPARPPDLLFSRSEGPTGTLELWFEICFSSAAHRNAEEGIHAHTIVRRSHGAHRPPKFRAPRHPDGGRLTPHRSGDRRIRFHDLRHTYTSLLIAQGAHPKYIQAQLGHASIQTTLDRYGHLMPDVHAAEAKKLDQLDLGRPATSDDDSASVNAMRR